MNIGSGLCKLLGPGELIAKYQPIVDLTEDKVVGFEILARWQHHAKGEVLPSVFIPILERSDSIDELTPRLLVQAFHMSAGLPSTFGLSINVSPLQLRTDTLQTQIEDLARSFSFDLGRLTIEVTESAYLENLGRAASVLAGLKRLGVKLSLDDFGTGYSSLSHLHALPFDEVKMDQSFVSSMTVRRDSRKIVAAVIGLGKSLGLATVGEGVEQSDQAEMLRCLGCERAQGWLFGRPLACDDVRTLIHQNLATAEDQHSLDASTHAVTGTERYCLEAFPTSRGAQLQAIYDGVPVALCFLDCDYRYISLNSHLAQMNARSVTEHLGRTVQQVAPETFAVVKGYLERARKGEAVRNVEAHFLLGNERRTLLLSYQPAFDEVGDVIGISVAAVDVSAREAMENKLREREDHYRNMVELNPQIPWTLDANGWVIEVSPRWREFTGQSEAEACKEGWLNALHPDDLERTRTALFQALRSQLPFTVEYRVKKDGETWHWLRSRGAPRLDPSGSVVRWYGSAECIDEQKRYEANLEEANSRLQEVLDALPIGVVIAEAPTGRILRRNPAAKALLLQDPVLFTTIADYAKRVAYYKEGRRMQSDDFPLARAIHFGEVTRSIQVFCDLGVTPGRWLKLTGNPLRTREGVIFGAVATIQEITPESAGDAPGKS